MPRTISCIAQSARIASASGLFLAAVLSLAAAPAAHAAQLGGRDVLAARDAAAAGEVLPLPRLVAMVQARPEFRGMKYIGGPQFDPARLRYALRFMDGDQVVVVHVDARTGRILARER